MSERDMTVTDESKNLELEGIIVLFPVVCGVYSLNTVRRVQPDTVGTFQRPA